VRDNNSIIQKHQCAFFKNNNDDCAILTKRICKHKHCSFFKTHIEFNEALKIDFLLESYKKGHITRERLIDLEERYYLKSRKEVIKMLKEHGLKL